MMYSFYQVAQWMSLIALLAAAVAAIYAWRCSRRRVYIFLLLACIGFALAPSTPWVMRALNQLELTKAERERQEAMTEEIIAVNEKYDPIPFAEVPYILYFPFGHIFLLIASIYFAKEERKKIQKSPQRKASSLSNAAICDADKAIYQKNNRSAFVTVLAWIFIILAGFTMLISIFQTVMVNAAFSREVIEELMMQAEENNFPIMFQFFISNIRFFVFGFLLVSATTLVSAIGLLFRKNWARIVFICMMIVGILWNIFKIVMHYIMLPSSPITSGAESSMPFDLIFNIMRILILIITGGVCIVFAWIIKKLATTPIRAEFTRENNSDEPRTGEPCGSSNEFSLPAVGQDDQ